jgi:hypothetical protein
MRIAEGVACECVAKAIEQHVLDSRTISLCSANVRILKC